MSHAPLTTASASSSNFQPIFDDALNKYKEKTKNDLLQHQLTAQLQNCKSPTAILDVLNRQYNIQQFIRSQSDGGNSKQWLSATVTVLCGFSAALGEGVGLVFSPAKVVFAGIGVFLIAAREVGASQDALVDLFGRIENFFERLETYVEVRPTEAMKNLVIKIMVEILGILAIATKETKRRWAKRYLKKLVGRTDIEDALKRLEKLSRDEALMAAVQVMRVTDRVDHRMEEVVDGVREARVTTQQIGNDLGDLRRDQLREKFQEWLSPPDPSINYNTARDAYHDGTAAWFTRGDTFQRWKVSDSESVLWIHGKPGSGKSILSSAIIHDVKYVFNAGSSYLGYFFFDFKDAAKQDTRALQSSLIDQLSSQSDTCFKILFDLYSTHDRGKRQPNEGALSQCLKTMFTVLGQVPIYLVIDALDECPNASKAIGVPPSRQKVLQFVKELVELRFPNLHVCITSRPEFDIRDVLGRLASFKVSLHDQDGQKQDIANYVRSIVYSDKEPVMKKWRREVKDLVIKKLTEKVDGMFRWVVCQLEMLRGCLARNVEDVLSELPKSLDETYQRVLREINEANQRDVYRLLQCLVVSIRPLRVEELAEVLAVDFDDAERIPKLNRDWRWEDQEEALQAACSSLIAIVDTGHSRLVQFSHFSVKEFLTSPRLASSSEDVSRYHISLEPAHIILAQSCLGVLLRLPVVYGVDKSSIENGFPLAGYAARHWADHAQFRNVSSRIWKGMEYLFHPDKRHFSAWLQLHDVDTDPGTNSILFPFTHQSYQRSNAPPLYYAALCGLHDLTEHLIVKHLQDVNAHGGYYVTPLVAALAGKHFRVAQLLYQHGADVDVQGDFKTTPLHATSYQGDLETMQWLLSRGGDSNELKMRAGQTPLHYAAWGGHVEAARILLEHNADPKAPDNHGKTPLHIASEYGHLNVARLLLARGADVNARNKHSSTPLHMASGKAWHMATAEGKLAAARLLLEHGADVGAVDDRGRTAFQVAEQEGHYEIMKLLSEYITN